MVLVTSSGDVNVSAIILVALETLDARECMLGNRCNSSSTTYTGNYKKMRTKCFMFLHYCKHTNEMVCLKYLMGNGGFL